MLIHNSGPHQAYTHPPPFGTQFSLSVMHAHAGASSAGPSHIGTTSTTTHVGASTTMHTTHGCVLFHTT